MGSAPTLEAGRWSLVWVCEQDNLMRKQAKTSEKGKRGALIPDLSLGIGLVSLAGELSSHRILQNLGVRTRSTANADWPSAQILLTVMYSKKRLIIEGLVYRFSYKLHKDTKMGEK